MDIRKLEEEKQQLMLQLDDADKAGLEAETLLQATTGKVKTLEKARNAAVQVCCLSTLMEVIKAMCRLPCRADSMAVHEACFA